MEDKRNLTLFRAFFCERKSFSRKKKKIVASRRNYKITSVRIYSKGILNFFNIAIS